MTEKVKVHIRPTISTYDATDNLYILMRLYGLLMPQRHKYAYMTYAAFIIGGGSFYMPFGFTKPFFESENLTKNMNAFFTTLQVAFNIYGGTIKVLFLAFMLNKLHGIRKMTIKLDARCKDIDEIMEQINVVRLGRKISVNYFITYIIYSLSTCICALLNGRPPYSIYLPFINWRNSRSEFWIAALIEFLLMDTACIQQAMNDSFPSVYICMLRAHVRILKLRIHKLGTKTKLSMHESLEELKMCIKDHQVILDFQRTIGPIISVTLFVQYSLSAFMLGLTLLNVTLFSNGISELIGSYAYVAAVCVQMFPVCYFAQSLQNESADLSDCIFHSRWISESSEYRKMIIFFMRRSQCLLKFTAGKLFPISLASVVNIIKFSFSLYTLMKSMDLDLKITLD